MDHQQRRKNQREKEKKKVTARLSTVFPSLSSSGNRKIMGLKVPQCHDNTSYLKGGLQGPLTTAQEKSSTTASRHPHQLLNALTGVSLTSYRKQHPNFLTLLIEEEKQFSLYPSRFLAENPTPPHPPHTYTPL